MSRRVATAQARKSRRKITLLWVGAMAAIIITLLVLEQTALLYVLATVGLTVLLVIVAMADLSGAHKTPSEPAPADDAAAIGTGISSAMPQPSAPARPAPRARKRT
jgi:peptidoglycan/LPS O-acetylase OafA/YrhL